MPLKKFAQNQHWSLMLKLQTKTIMIKINIFRHELPNVHWKHGQTLEKKSSLASLTYRAQQQHPYIEAQYQSHMDISKPLWISSKMADTICREEHHFGKYYMDLNWGPSKLSSVWYLGGIKNTYGLFNLRAVKFTTWYENCVLLCMSKIFYVEIQRVPLKFNTKYLTHTLKDVYFIRIWNFKSSNN